jgi:hypothetical protein
MGCLFDAKGKSLSKFSWENHFPNFLVCLSLEKLVNEKHFPVKDKFGLVSRKMFPFILGGKHFWKF